MTYNPLNQYIDLLLKNTRPESLFYGCEGFWVKMLRRLLAHHGYGDSAWLDHERGVSAICDDGLVNLVREFQGNMGLSVDGEVGPETWAWLGCADVDDLGECTLAYARHEFLRGAREIGGNNRGEYVDKYMGFRNKKSWPWCVAFATWCAMQANGGRPLYKERLSSSRLVAEAQKSRAFAAERSHVKAGDLVIVAGGKTGWKHTSIAQKITDDTVYVIEGNVRGGDAIAPRYRIPGTRDAVRHGKYALSKVAFVIVDSE